MRQDYQDDPLNLTEIKGSLLNAAMDLVTFNRTHAADFVDTVLILHGAEDGVVSVTDSMDSYREISSRDKELHIYPFLRHQVLNEPSRRLAVYQEILDWMKNMAKSMKSQLIGYTPVNWLFINAAARFSALASAIIFKERMDAKWKLCRST